MFHYGKGLLIHLVGPIWGFLINVDVDVKCIENLYENDEINDKNLTKSPTRGIKSYLHQYGRKTWLEI